MNLHDLLDSMLKHQASDLHLVTQSPPMLRINGEIVPVDRPPLDEGQCKSLIYSVLTHDQIASFETTGELDLAFTFKDVGRFRMNVYRQKGDVGAAIRHIPDVFLTFEGLGLPSIVYRLMKLTRGLILVTGPSGSGKSTTIASMVHYLSREMPGHIVTIEDPIEYIHAHKRSIVSQREVGADTRDFHIALRQVLRQDPNVIVIGEMRDLETIQAAMTLAETGHLVLATLHTSDAAQTVNRIIDAFPPYQQSQIRGQLSFVLQAIVSQVLIGRPKSIGMIMAYEILINTPAVSNVIRENKIENLQSLIQTGSKFGMQTLNQTLYHLCLKNSITYQQALDVSTDPDGFSKLFPTNR